MDPVTRYAVDVLEGRVVAGKWQRLACKRHVDDIARQNLDDFPYRFEIDRAQRVFDFFGYLVFTGGDRSIVGKQIALQPFQIFLLGSVFGWVHKVTGYRRYKKAYIQLGRKNGKSLLVSGIGLYMLMADDWWSSQVYATATKKDQAKIVWSEAVKMVKASPHLRKRLPVRKSTGEILFEDRDSYFKPLSRDTSSLDGFNPHCGIVDEFHQHSTNEMVKLLDDGTVQQTQPLIVIITTAGFDLNSPCVKEYNYCTKMLEGAVANDEYFVFITQLDENDEPFNERNWIKANPLVASTENGMAALRRLAREAKDKGGDDLRDFLTKSLNLWVDMKKDGYMPMGKWLACGVPKICPLILQNRECYVGVDLSAKIDLTSIAFEFPLDDGYYALKCHSFMPEDTIAQRRKTDKAPYDDWVRNGHITPTPGAVVDYRYIMDYIERTAEENGWIVKEIDFDPHNSTQFATEMHDDRGFEMVEIAQRITMLNEPTKNFREAVFQGKVIHENDPVVNWAMANAITRKDRVGNIALDKERAIERIDPVAAIINAHVRAMISEPAFVLEAFAI